MNFPALQRLAHHLEVVPRHFLTFSEKALTFKANPGKWSKKEILGHLIDSARYNLMRFTEISFLPRPYKFQTYEQDELVALQKYQQQSAEDLVMYWESLNRQIYFVLQNHPAEAASWPLILPNGEEKDLFFLADDYVVHLEHHLQQIFGEAFAPPAFKRSFSIEEGKKLLESVETPFVLLSKDSHWEFEYYAPQGADLQQPHDRDEVYFICSGSGMFVNGEERHAFQAGDLLFVPRGVVHRFEDFPDDFACWVVFAGTKKIPTAN